MRGEIIYKILDFLEDQSASMTNLLSAFLSSGYGATMSKIDFVYNKKQRNQEAYISDREKKRNLQKYLFKLKSDGLILENSFNNVILSVKGKEKLKLLKKNKILSLPHSQKIKKGFV